MGVAAEPEDQEDAGEGHEDGEGEVGCPTNMMGEPASCGVGEDVAERPERREDGVLSGGVVSVAHAGQEGHEGGCAHAACNAAKGNSDV